MRRQMKLTGFGLNWNYFSCCFDPRRWCPKQHNIVAESILTKLTISIFSSLDCICARIAVSTQIRWTNTMNIVIFPFCLIMEFEWYRCLFLVWLVFRDLIVYIVFFPWYILCFVFVMIENKLLTSYFWVPYVLIKFNLNVFQAFFFCVVVILTSDVQRISMILSSTRIHFLLVSYANVMLSR